MGLLASRPEHGASVILSSRDEFIDLSGNGLTDERTNPLSFVSGGDTSYEQLFVDRPVHCAAGSERETNFGVVSLAAPQAY